MRTSNMSRREAIGVGGAMGGLGALALMMPRVIASAEEVAWDGKADVVICGAGAAGDIAAIDLVEKGDLDVILLESLDTPIASSHLCGGDITMCETEMEPGSRDELFEDLVAAAQGDCQEDLVRSYVDMAPEVYSMLTEWGVKFYTTAQVSYMSRPWEHIPEGDSGISIMSVLENRIASNDRINLICGNRARKLILNTEGRVVGVEAETENGAKRYSASAGVVITTGSFTQNRELAKALGKKGSYNITPTTGVGAKGDGLLMGLAAGADVSYLGAGVTPTGPIGYTTLQNCGPFMSNGAIIVGLDGKRFHNEGDNYVLISQDAIELPQPFFQIYDSTMRKILEDWTGLAIYELPVEPEITGETLEELADNIKSQYPDFNTETFVSTVNNYSAYVHNGEDLEFGRTNISGESGELLPIENAPFYAVPSTIGTTHFNGGLKTDKDQRVVSAFDGNPIPGLYAAGEATGGFHGYGYMSGSAFGKALIHGVVAARALASDSTN